MRRTEHIARVARRRLMARRVLTSLGPALAAGSAMGLAGVFVAKAAGMDAWTWGSIAAGSLVVSALVGAGWGFLRQTDRLSDQRGALEIDRALDLRERLSSAIMLRHGADDVSRDPFASLAMEEAEQTAVEISDEQVRRSVPIWSGEGSIASRRWSRRGWRAWPIVTLATVMCGMWIPAWFVNSGATSRGARMADAEQQAEQRRVVADELADVLDARHEVGDHATEHSSESDTQPETETLAAALEREYQALEELRKQLEQTGDGRDGQSMSPEDAAREAAESFSRLAEAQENAAAEEELTGDKLTEQLAALAHQNARDEATSAEQPERASESPSSDANAAENAEPREMSERPEELPLVEAVRHGDLERAQEEAQRLAEELASQDEQQRQHAADELRKLAEDLERSAQQHEQNQQNDSTSRSEERPPRTSSGPSNQHEQSRDSSVDPSPSVDKVRERRAAERANEQVRELGKQMKDAAEEIRQQQSQHSREPLRPDQQPAADEQQSAQSSGQHEQSTQQSEHGEKPESSTQRDQNGERDGRQRQPSAMDRLRQQLQKMNECQGGECGKPGEGQSPENSSSRSRAQRLRDDAGQNREMARRMLERATPEERRRINEAMQQLAQRGEHSPEESTRAAGAQHGEQAGGAGRLAEAGAQDNLAQENIREPTRTEDLFAAENGRRPGGEEPIARWYSDAPDRLSSASDGNSGGATASESAREYVRSASKRAEKAVEDKQVPSRYERLLKRYFRRLPDRVGPATNGSGGELAPDADAPSGDADKPGKAE